MQYPPDQKIKYSCILYSKILVGTQWQIYLCLKSLLMSVEINKICINRKFIYIMCIGTQLICTVYLILVIFNGNNKNNSNITVTNNVTSFLIKWKCVEISGGINMELVTTRILLLFICEQSVEEFYFYFISFQPLLIHTSTYT